MKYDDWLTKEHVAKRLGVSERTVMRLADRKKFRQAMRPREGGSPLAVFNPEDVESFAAKRAAVVSVMPDDAPVPARRTNEGFPAIATAAAALPMPAMTFEIAQRRESLRKDKYLTLAEASLLTKLSQKEISTRLKDVVRRGAGNFSLYPREAVEQL